MAQFFQNRPSLEEVIGTSLGGGLGQAINDLAYTKLQQLSNEYGEMPSMQSGGSSSVQRMRSARQPLGRRVSARGPITDPFVDASLEDIIQRAQPDFQEKSQQSEIESTLKALSPEQKIKNDLYSQDIKEDKLRDEIAVKDASKAKSMREIKKDIQEVSEKKFNKLPPGAQAEKEGELLTQALKNPNLTPTQKSKLRTQLTKRQEQFDKKQLQIDKATTPFYKKINDEARGARDGNIRLNKMLDLVNKGQLVGPVLAGILETVEHGIGGVGLNLFGLTSTDTQEFKKIQADFLKDVKNIFGARVTNDEVKRYLNRIPSLTQSDEGKRLVIRDLKSFNDAALAKQEVMQRIIKENGGYRPHNIEELVEEQVRPILDDIAQKISEPYVSPQELEREYKARKSPMGRVLSTLLGS